MSDHDQEITSKEVTRLREKDSRVTWLIVGEAWKDQAIEKISKQLGEEGIPLVKESISSGA